MCNTRRQKTKSTDVIRYRYDNTRDNMSKGQFLRGCRRMRETCTKLARMNGSCSTSSIRKYRTVINDKGSNPSNDSAGARSSNETRAYVGTAGHLNGMRYA